MLKYLAEIRILSCSPTASPLTFESGQVWTFMDIQNISKCYVARDKIRNDSWAQSSLRQPMVQNPEADPRNGFKEVKDETQVSGTNQALISYRTLLIVEPYRSLHCSPANMLVRVWRMVIVSIFVPSQQRCWIQQWLSDFPKLSAVWFVRSSRETLPRIPIVAKCSYWRHKWLHKLQKKGLRAEPDLDAASGLATNPNLCRRVNSQSA